MAVRGWGGTLATAVGVAAAVGAAQLGFGYGLGIVTWTPPDTAAGGSPDSTWNASLAWASWIAATSTITGAVGAQRLSRRSTVGAHARHRPSGIPSALAAALGALVTVLLVAVPAGAANPTGSAGPQNVAAAYAGAGVLVGVLFAVWALRSPSAAVNVIASVGWLWLLAVVTVVDAVLAARGTDGTQLGVWQLSADRPVFWLGDFYWPTAVLSLGSALVVGALAARRAARSTYRRVGAAVSGTAGPLLVAVAYLLTMPRLPETGAEQLSAQLVAAYAVVAGLAGSALVAALAQRREARTTPPAATTTPVDTEDVTANTRADADAATPAADLDAFTAAALPAPTGEPGPAGEAVPDAAPVESDASAPSRRTAGSTPRVPRPRREKPPVDGDPGTAGSAVTAGGEVPDRLAPDPAEPAGTAGTTPADGPVFEPRPRSRAAPRRPRD